jgi:hypothetical protein
MRIVSWQRRKRVHPPLYGVLPPNRRHTMGDADLRGLAETKRDFPRLHRIAAAGPPAAELFSRDGGVVGRIRVAGSRRCSLCRRPGIASVVNQPLVAGLVAAMGNRREWRGIFLSVESITC